jgi:hypothetical protein
MRRLLGAVLAAGLALPSAALAQDPPLSGTAFIDPDIITSADRTTLKSIRYAGRGKRSMFDRRKDRYVVKNAFLFTAGFSDRLKVEVQVNPEFGSRAKALAEARRYATVLGRMPRVLRVAVKELVIHKGKRLFGGGTTHVLIHTGQAAEYERDGVLEEIIAHEAAHTALDPKHLGSSGWRAAVRADPTFISTYARDNPDREDVAESFVPWLALRYRRDRLDPETVTTIEQTIPNRLAYFDRQRFKVAPLG